MPLSASSTDSSAPFGSSSDKAEFPSNKLPPTAAASEEASTGNTTAASNGFVGGGDPGGGGSGNGLGGRATVVTISDLSSCTLQVQSESRSGKRSSSNTYTVQFNREKTRSVLGLLN